MESSENHSSPVDGLVPTKINIIITDMMKMEEDIEMNSGGIGEAYTKSSIDLNNDEYINYPITSYEDSHQLPLDLTRDFPINGEGYMTRPDSELSLMDNNDPIKTKLMSSQLRLGILCFGLVLTTILAGADETIVSTALGSITREFHQAGNMTWVAGAYLITATAFQPLYGKFSDIFGRGIVISVAIGMFIIGSIGCGLANSLTTLILFRGVTGIGSGGLESLGYIIIADVTPLYQRGIYMSLINVTFSIANIMGPLMGGLFVDYINWRWAFYVNIPLAVVAMMIMLSLLPNPGIKTGGGLSKKLARVDITGTLGLVTGILLLVLAINWGGVNYGWDSLPVLGCLTVGVLVIILFGVYESQYAEEPIVPFHVFKRNVICANLATVCNGMVLSTFVYYWPLYHQLIHNSPATLSGLQALPVLLGDSIVAALTGLLSYHPRTYCNMMRIGMILMLMGVLMLASIQRPYTTSEELLGPLLVGLGLGLNTQTALVISQASVPESDLAIVTSLATFSLSIGGVFGLAIVNTAYQTTLRPYHHLTLTTLTPYHYHLAYLSIFLTLLPIIAIGLVATLMLHDPPSNPPHSPPPSLPPIPSPYPVEKV